MDRVVHYLGLRLTLSLLGTGAYKIGANYAAGVLPQKKVAKLGYVQNLWLSGPEHNLTEVRIPTHPALLLLGVRGA